MITNFKDVVSEIKTIAPIHELISEYIQIKRSGRNYKALCPFHNDKNPSLQIHIEKGIFKCFSCGAGGDIITFYSKINNKNWTDSIVDLANKYGIKIEYGDENKTENKIKNELYEVNKIALEFFKNNLFIDAGKEALNYIKNERLISDDSINKFGIGFAQNSWDSLFNYLSNKKQFQKELLLSSGLFIARENKDGYYDRFRNRVIFPIFDEKNNVIGFGGRILPSSTDTQAKYINSPETIIFNKGYILYGFNFAKENIKKEDFAILTEGYLDVITSHQYGLNNTVATLGTALSSSQMKLLSKYTSSNKVCICMDSDQAGIKALENVFNILQDTDKDSLLDVRVTTNLPAKDLDESLKIENSEKLKERIFNGEKIAAFIFKREIDSYIKASTENDNHLKKHHLDRIFDLLSGINDLLEKNEYIKLIAHKLNLNEELISQKLTNTVKRKKRFVKEPTREEKNNLETDEFKMYTQKRFIHAEKELLLLYLSTFPNPDSIRNEISSITFIDDKNKLIKDFLDNITDHSITAEEVINQLMIEFNEYNHIMSRISELSIELDNSSLNQVNYSKNKDKIISEAKTSINWWITNEQKMKKLNSLLLESSNEEEKNSLLKQMIDIVKNNNDIK